MKTFDEIKLFLSQHKEEIHSQYKVKEIGVFGSFAKSEHHHRSDIDILVKFEEGQTRFDNYIDLKFYLEKRFRRKVDLVLKDSIRKELKQIILRETVYV